MDDRRAMLAYVIYTKIQDDGKTYSEHADFIDGSELRGLYDSKIIDDSLILSSGIEYIYTFRDPKHWASKNMNIVELSVYIIYKPETAIDKIIDNLYNQRNFDSMDVLMDYYDILLIHAEDDGRKDIGIDTYYNGLKFIEATMDNSKTRKEFNDQCIECYRTFLIEDDCAADSRFVNDVCMLFLDVVVSNLAGSDL